MNEIINLLCSTNLEQVIQNARLNKANPKELALLAELSDKIELTIEAKLTQLESIAKAVQVACLDDGNTGMFNQKTDGFHFAYWLEEEAKTLQRLTAILTDAVYLKNAREVQA